MAIPKAEEWEKQNWFLHPMLSVPKLRPAAIQCAIFDFDPLPKFIARKKQFLERMGSDPDDAARRAAAATVWDIGFMEITGDKIYLLVDFESGKTSETADEKGMRAAAIRKEYFLLSSNGPDGPKWLASKALRHHDDICCWCIPFEAKKGTTVELTLDLDNALDMGKTG
jgi:hypothetical protein